MKKHTIKLAHIGLLLLSCASNVSQNNPDISVSPVEAATHKGVAPFDTTFKTIHVFVALCDNKYQGIVPVPAKVGNGQDPNNNLYWGCGFGVRTYFRRSREWVLVKTSQPDSVRLERLVFKHATKNYYLVADAYDGKHIRRCTEEFMNSSCGKLKDTLHIGTTPIGLAGSAQMVCYVGHDGLMEFQLDGLFFNTDGRKRDAIILACASKQFFSPYLDETAVNPVVWTSGLMAPEAYTLHDALTGYVNGESSENIRTRAAKAYASHQKCSERAARNLLISGW